MRAINYKHLQYFWAIAKRGGVMRASEFLNVSPQSISGQIKVFEEAMGTVLFRKAGRGLELTALPIQIRQLLDRDERQSSCPRF